MRIISKFDDYYDRAQALGHDTGLTFVRQLEEFQAATQHKAVPAGLAVFLAFAVKSTPQNIQLTPKKGPFARATVAFSLVWFGGRLYPVAQVRRERRGELLADDPFSVFDHATLLNVLKECGFDLEERDKRALRWGVGHTNARASSEVFFNLRGSEELMTAALEHRVAIASWCRHGDLLCQNPVLRDLQFFRCLDAWQASQELAMFLGNLAAPDRVPVVIEDRYRIAQHGFDKYSFRKPPQTA
jgi:hypothetical protein